MHIDKATILEHLHKHGKSDQAEQAERELPDQVDTEEHADLLTKYGLSMSELGGMFRH